MVEQQLEALKDAIFHWEENLERVRKQNIPYISAEDCVCCNIWFDHDCEGCPIFEYTHKIECRNTPYQNVSRQCDLLTCDPRDPHQWFILESFVQTEIDF